MDGLRETSFAKTALVLFLITFGVKILGLLREVLIAAYIGMNHVTDAYNIAILSTTLITGVMGIAIGSSLIPILTGLANNKGEKEKQLFFANAFCTFMIIALIIAVLIYILAIPIVKILAPGFDKDTVMLSAKLLQVAFIRINAVVAASFITQYLNTKNCFYTPMIAASIGTVVLVGYLQFAGSSANISSLMIMTVISDIMQVLWMIPALYRQGFRFKLYCNPKDLNLLLFISLSLPATINYFVQQIGTIVNRGLASQLEVGSVSALSYANSIVMMINMTVSLSIATVIFPQLAEALNRNNMGKAINLFQQGIFLVCVFLIPGTVGLIVMAEPISSVLFERGAFTNENSAMTALALSGYSSGIIAYACYELSNRFFNSMKDTKTPMKAAHAGVIIMILFSFLFYKPLRLYGLSFATSIMQIVMGALLLLIINKKHGKVLDRKLIFNIIRVIIATLIMGIVLIYIKDIDIISHTGGILDLLVKIIIAVAVFLINLALLFWTKNNVRL